MELFDYPFHVPTHTYPKGTSFNFGGAYANRYEPRGLPCHCRSHRVWRANPRPGN